MSGQDIILCSVSRATSSPSPSMIDILYYRISLRKTTQISLPQELKRKKSSGRKPSGLFSGFLQSLCQTSKARFWDREHKVSEYLKGSLTSEERRINRGKY